MSNTEKDGEAKKTGNEKSGPAKVIKTPIDLQRFKLQKLMKNPSKEVIIPNSSKEKTPRAPLEFIRNIWGSSAGAGSGDFHVYRGVRRREYARQKYITEKAKKEEADDAYQKKMEQNKTEAEKRTARKRAKRLKMKAKLKQKKNMKKPKSASNPEESGDSTEESDGDDESNETQAKS